MVAIAGILVVLLAVLGGFLLEHGNPLLLIQPSEVLIIAGASLGITIVANPGRVIRKIAQGTWTVLRPKPLTRSLLLRYLLMLYEVFGYGQKAGVMALEEEVENPGSSRLFSKYPEFLKDSSLREYVCDSLRMLVIGATTPGELDRLMGIDLNIQRRGAQEPSGALGTIADSLPGLGIVAAVLGVVITMSSIGAAPESIGQKVAAALVGTFLGILLCYGVVGPIAARIETNAEERMQLLEILRTAVAAFAHGAAPILAVEYARRSIPTEMRPSFGELEKIIRRDAKIPSAADGAAGGGMSPNSGVAA